MVQRQFDFTPPASNATTSRAAAEAIEWEVPALRARVLAFIAKRLDGATDEEIQLALGMDGNTQRPRRRELVQLGRIVDSGTTRATSTGRAAIVWRVKR